MDGPAEFLTGIFFKLLGLNTERKREVAQYLSEISETVGKFGPRLRAGAPFEELSSYASETNELALRFSAATSDVLQEKERDQFVHSLQRAFNAKEILARKGQEREELLVLIGEVAGQFRAAATSLRGSASKFGS